jgi:hypothetical protein
VVHETTAKSEISFFFPPALPKQRTMALRKKRVTAPESKETKPYNRNLNLHTLTLPTEVRANLLRQLLIQPQPVGYRTKETSPAKAINSIAPSTEALKYYEYASGCTKKTRISSVRATQFASSSSSSLIGTSAGACGLPILPDRGRNASQVEEPS